MSRKEKREKKQGNKTIQKIMVTALFLVIVCFVLKYAQNYIRDEIKGKTNLVVNNSNITADLEKDIFLENGTVYMAKEDAQNFFDEYIYFDEKYDMVITGSKNRIASMVVGETKMNDNGSTISLKSPVIEKDDTYYIPLSELDNIYQIKTQYIEETDTVVVESTDRKVVVADSNKDNQVKRMPTSISGTVDKIARGESVTIVNDSEEDGWIKVRTNRGKLGYVKQNTLTNELVMREELKTTPKVEGKVSMVWDYVYEYASIPAREGKIKGINVVAPTLFTLIEEGDGDVLENVGESEKAYIKWAHENGYQVWPTISNAPLIDTTSKIMNDYQLRQGLINRIVSMILKYDLDGINLDFECMYPDDKDLYSRFIIELQPRLNEIGKVLSVNVTAPDGSPEWSMCYDRHTIGKVADYIVFMAYDQHGASSDEAGTTAGCDWVEVNLDKFVGTQEEIAPEKIILGIPFYTWVWPVSGGEPEAYHMKSLKELIPENASQTWDDALKQYVVKYQTEGGLQTVWVEDERSIGAKLDLVSQYKLAGAAYWAKDRETNGVWDVISEKLGI